MSEAQPHPRPVRATASAFVRRWPTPTTGPGRPTPRGRAWLAGSEHAHVLELGAGTGKLTELLAALGHSVVATDPLPTMLAASAPAARVEPVVASAEHIPMRLALGGHRGLRRRPSTGSTTSGRCPRSRGCCAPAGTSRWSGTRDETDPVGAPAPGADRADAGDARTPRRRSWARPVRLRGAARTFRFWQPLTAAALADLVRSRSNVATMSRAASASVLAKVDDALRRATAAATTACRCPT